MKQTDPQFKLRLTESLKEQLTEAARKNNRTISAEMLARLQDSFGPAAAPIEGATPMPPAQFDALVEALAAKTMQLVEEAQKNAARGAKK